MNPYLISALALTLSALTLTWNVYRYYRWERPVIRVAGAQWGAPTSDPRNRRAGFTTTVTNTGDQATVVLRVQWEVEDQSRHRRSFDAKHGGGGIESLGTRQSQEDPELPLHLERHDHREWSFTMPAPASVSIRSRPTVDYISRRGQTRAYGQWQAWTR